MDAHKTTYIADASVLLKWATEESDGLMEAFQLRKDFENDIIDIIVPAHCFTEICNMLGREKMTEAISFISFLINSEITEHHLTFDVASIAFHLMKQYRGISFYDAHYHALAIHGRGVFLTADIRYFKKTYQEGRIMLLKDYGKKK